MAREFTEQEKQNLSRIREQRAAADRDMADAIRNRQQLESRLREIQREMASPDGITNSPLFAEEVNGLQGQIQIARQYEQEADIKRSRLSAEEFRALAPAAGRPVEPASLNRFQRRPAVSASPATSAYIASGLGGLRSAQANFERNRAARAALEERLIATIKKTALIVFVSALFVAALADILSLVDFGWVVSWLIPMIVWFMVRRVTNINAGGDAIVAAHQAAKRQLTLLQQRLRPSLVSSRNLQLLASTKVEDLKFAGRSYAATFVRDTIVTQLVELIPFVDWLPLYIGQVVKVFVDQNIAYQKVRLLMPRLKHVHQQIERLELFEIQFSARQIATVVRAQQVISAQRRRGPAAQPQQGTAPSSLALGFAT